MRSIFCFLLLTASVFTYGQNLLMNGDFEDENICTEYIKNCAPEGWISTSLWGDYYFRDSRNAFEGDHFVGLMFAKNDSKNPRRYKFIRSRLLCALRAGAEYKLEFYMKSAHVDIDSLGIYFSPDDVLFRKTIVAEEQPQLWLKDGLEKKEKDKWTKVSLIYKATGTENFISIGDFRKTTHHFAALPDLGNDFYYFIDNIELTPVNRAEHLCADAARLKEEEYDFDPRHNMLEKMVYHYRKNPPPVAPATKTIVQRIDTLVIPDVLFATNSYALSQPAHTVLDSFVSRSAGFSVDSLVVEGHTDSTGTISHNEKLSLNRAGSVASFLQPHFRAPVVTRGWASTKPVADNRTAPGRQKNRRVEIYLYIRD